MNAIQQEAALGNSVHRRLTLCCAPPNLCSHAAFPFESPSLLPVLESGSSDPKFIVYIARYYAYTPSLLGVHPSMLGLAESLGAQERPSGRIPALSPGSSPPGNYPAERPLSLRWGPLSLTCTSQ